MDITVNAAECLIDELSAAAQAYYQDMAEPLMSDEEFDEKISLLSQLRVNPEFSGLFLPGSPGAQLLGENPGLGSGPATGAQVVVHERPMLSLGKAKNEAELKAYVARAGKAGARNFVLQCKMDGFALSVTYSGGKIARMATRGTGTEGEDVTYLLSSPGASIYGLPRTVSHTGKFEVRGELFFTDEQYAAATQARIESGEEGFRHSRNAVVGLMRRAKQGIGYPVEFSFAAYSVYGADGRPRGLSVVSGLGIRTVDDVTREEAPGVQLSGFRGYDDIRKAVEDFGAVRVNFRVPTDGVVVKPSNEAEMLEKMGSNSHHPLSQIAYKYPGTSAQTRVLGMTITVGSTGRLTPTAVLEPVTLDGVTITSASCHNYRWCHERDLRTGSVVTVHRANDVIPQISAVLMNPEGSVPLEVPSSCPSCGEKLEYDSSEGFPPKTLRCPGTQCPSQAAFGLRMAVRKDVLDIDGIGTTVLDALIADGKVKDVADLYELDEEYLAGLPLGETKTGGVRRLGPARAGNIMEHIRKSKDLPLHRLLVALNIQGLGTAAAKALVKEFGTIDAIMAATPGQIASIDGFADITAQRIAEGLRNRAQIVRRMRSAGVSFIGPVNTPGGAQNGSQGLLSGLSFSISGEVPAPFPNRNAWVEYLEKNGAVFRSSPGKDTSFMVADENGTSSKIVKARKLGVPFITAREFTEKYVS